METVSSVTRERFQRNHSSYTEKVQNFCSRNFITKINLLKFMFSKQMKFLPYLGQTSLVKLGPSGCSNIWYQYPWWLHPAAALWLTVLLAFVTQ